MTAAQKEAIENLADRFMGALRCASGAVIDDGMLAALRSGFRGILRLSDLSLPDDAFLDELLLEMAQWHDLPIAERAP